MADPGILIGDGAGFFKVRNRFFYTVGVGSESGLDENNIFFNGGDPDRLFLKVESRSGQSQTGTVALIIILIEKKR